MGVSTGASADTFLSHLSGLADLMRILRDFFLFAAFNFVRLSGTSFEQFRSTLTRSVLFSDVSTLTLICGFQPEEISE